MKLLTTADAIRSSIRRLFADHSKANVAVVAFIGRDALEYLPDNIAGTQIYCWPKAGGTHPDAIGERVAAGAIVRFVEGLPCQHTYGGFVAGKKSKTLKKLKKDCDEDSNKSNFCRGYRYRVLYVNGVC